MDNPAKDPVCVATVLLDTAIDKPLDYAIPEQLQGKITPGMRVSVPVRKKLLNGTVLETKATSSFKKLALLQDKLHEAPLVQKELLQLCAWMAKYYICPLRKVLKTTLPPSVRGKLKYKEQLFVSLNVSKNEGATLCEELRRTKPAQALILDLLLKKEKGLFLSELLEQEGISKSPVDTLVKKKILSCMKAHVDRTPFASQDYFKSPAKKLNPEQKSALEAIYEGLDKGIFSPRLIYGVTGSGKTEIYLQAIDHALSLGKKVLFLVPEIALTSQTIERLYSRFEHKVALLHHRLSEGEKHDTWHQILKGEVSIVVGARSAIFVPIPSLGLIIVDEEHDGSYKQTDESPCYHGRDVALMRAKLENATILLGTATPSLETYTNALNGKYALSVLTQRAGNASLPKIFLVDMKLENERQKSFALFSDLLLEKIKQRISSGEQTLLLLNRRGYHTAQTCKKCGHINTCPECDVSLTFHRQENLLSCHLCDYKLYPLPKACPKCHSKEDLKFKGVGTEMVEASLHALLPDIRTLRLDADTTRHKGSHEQIFKQFRAGKADVLIGTQMIAKGLHFPSVTLVGVLNTDSTLQIPDFRASEQLFQLVTQVSGRAGRADLPGEVILQTMMPEHPVLQLAKTQDFSSFYEHELLLRKDFDYPPFTHLIKLTLTGKECEKTEKHAEKLRDYLLSFLPKEVEVFPIVPCGHAKMKGRYRFQCLLKSKNRISPLLSCVQEMFGKNANFSLSIDVDPLATFF